ncbi:hypothetical protein JCM4814A_12280 [Streptomyces phaeofaciens JCM 4814]
MLMLQPPGCGSTYRYVLPLRHLCKREFRVMPPIWGMRGSPESVYVGRRGYQSYQSSQKWIIG